MAFSGVTYIRASCRTTLFPCKGTADGRNGKCRRGFRQEALTAAFRKFPRALEIWVFRPHPLASQLPFPPFCPQWFHARKRSSLPRSPKRLHKREKNGISNIIKHRNMRVRRMTIEQGRRVGIDRFPNFHRSGSIKGMKKLYYGKDCLLIRCGSYIYDVSTEPRIYYQASV